MNSPFRSISSPTASTNSPITQKYKQLEDLLEKSEKRAERQKTLNDQLKYQLLNEQEKNNISHKENSDLKKQVFKAQKDYKNIKEELDDERKKSLHLSKELQRKLDQNLCTKCSNLIVVRNPSLLAKQNILSPLLNKQLVESIINQDYGNNNGNVFQYDGQNNVNNGVIPKRESQLSISDDENKDPAFERTRQRTMTISVRFNNDKGADHIRAISRSIVARNYESDFQDGIVNSGILSPYPGKKEPKLSQFKNFERQVKKVSSSQNISEEKDSNGEEEQKNKQIHEASDSIQSSQDSIDSQDLPQITFQQKNSSNKASQFKQKVMINFQRRMSKTHSTIRSTFENIEETESQGQNSATQSIKSIVLQKKSQNTFQELQNPEMKSKEKLQQIEKQGLPNTNSQDLKININGSLNQIPEEGISLSTSNIHNASPSPTPINNSNDKDNYNSNDKDSYNHGNKNNDIIVNNNNNTTNNNNLFEKFFILGCEKDDMREFDQDFSTQDALLPGKILYSYPQLNAEDPQDEVLKVINEFVFPKGIKSKKIKVTSSFRKITQYVLPNRKDQRKQVDKFYMFTMKSSVYYESLNLHKSQDQSSVIDTINPHRLMYCYCFKTKDYLETTADESTFESDKFIPQRKFWENKIVYCFVSYYPFYELFQGMLTNVIDQVKISRISSYSQLGSDNKVFYKLDSDCIKQIVQDNLQPIFTAQRKNTISDFQQILMIDTLAGPLKYVIGNKQIINVQTHKWSLALSLSNLSLQNLMFIFNAILLENTVVFTSKNKCLLTQTIHTFEQLIYPFSWPYPIIYLLPDSLITLFDSPLPIIMGVNKTTKQLLDEDIFNRYKDHIFFDLDLHKIHCNNKQIIKKITSVKPNLNNLFVKIEKVYSQINPQGLLQRKSSVFSDPSKKDSIKHKEEYELKYYSNKQDDQISEIILNIFNESLRQCFVDILPKKIENMIQEDGQIDYIAFANVVIKKAYPQDKQFFQSFINTQIFTYFIENYYQFD